MIVVIKTYSSKILNNLLRNVEIPFPTNRLAEISYHVLRVDSEPKRSGVQKELKLKDNVLLV